MTISTSTRKVTTVPTSTEKRRTLYISNIDPRNTAKYISSYPGQVIVLTQAEYQGYLKTQNVSNLSNQDVLAESGNTVATLHPPTSLYANVNDPAYITEVTGNNGNTVWQLKISVDPSIDDVSTDGPITYEAIAVAPDPTTTSNKQAAGGTQSVSPKGVIVPSTTVLPGVSLSTVTIVSATNGLIRIKWSSVPKAIGYEITVVGANLPYTNGQTSFVYNSPSTATETLHDWEISPTVPLQFHGDYTFKIAAKYTSSTTKAVTIGPITIF